MALSLQSVLEAPIIELDTIDSTNNYAMSLIDADTAQSGLTIVAGEQTAGKGQRGRSWLSEAGQSLIMSLIIVPNNTIDEQFLFNTRVVTAIADFLQAENEGLDIRIKWPNDIIVNDKKAGGILIENVIKGNAWAYSVVGIGLNIMQDKMPVDLPYATSLHAAGGKQFDIKRLQHGLRRKILERTTEPFVASKLLDDYNEYLFRRGEWQLFESNGNIWKAMVNKVNEKGELEVTKEDGTISNCIHGQVNWKW